MNLILKMIHQHDLAGRDAATIFVGSIAKRLLDVTHKHQLENGMTINHMTF